jgi:hypothetical protein
VDVEPPEHFGVGARMRADVVVVDRLVGRRHLV